MYILHVPKNTEKWLKSAGFWIFWVKTTNLWKPPAYTEANYDPQKFTIGKCMIVTMLMIFSTTLIITIIFLYDNKNRTNSIIPAIMTRTGDQNSCKRTGSGQNSYNSWIFGTGQFYHFLKISGREKSGVYFSKLGNILNLSQIKSMPGLK